MMALRDRRARVVGYGVSGCPDDVRNSDGPDEEARRIVERVPMLARLAGRSVIVPVTPALVRDGAITRFASVDAVWLVATEALDDPPTRRAVDRLIGRISVRAPGVSRRRTAAPSLTGSTIVLDAARTPAAVLEGRIRVLNDADCAHSCVAWTIG